jgi:hypothetical protein
MEENSTRSKPLQCDALFYIEENSRSINKPHLNAAIYNLQVSVPLGPGAWELLKEKSYYRSG